jgi:predicted nucleic acid-binding protein
MSDPPQLPSAVVDTDVISLVFKKDTRAALYRPYLDGWQLTLSFMSIAELQRWALERRWGQRRRSELDQYLHRFTVFHSDQDLCRWWAAVMVSARQAGRRIEVADAWIAATALLFGIPLITHNPGDYAGVDGCRSLTGTPP